MFYPLLIAAALFYNWQYALAIFGLRLVIQALVYGKCLYKLGEKDLFPLFIFFDLWMFFYYLLFAPALIRKPKPNWK
jgi:hypothetical protein